MDMKPREGGLTPDNSRSETPPGLSPSTALLFAVACGLSVANVYFAHPLLDAMARDFSIDPGSVGIVVTVTALLSSST